MASIEEYYFTQISDGRENKNENLSWHIRTFDGPVLCGIDKRHPAHFDVQEAMSMEHWKVNKNYTCGTCRRIFEKLIVI